MLIRKEGYCFFYSMLYFSFLKTFTLFFSFHWGSFWSSHKLALIVLLFALCIKWGQNSGCHCETKQTSVVLIELLPTQTKLCFRPNKFSPLKVDLQPAWLALLARQNAKMSGEACSCLFVARTCLLASCSIFNCKPSFEVRIERLIQICGHTRSKASAQKSLVTSIKCCLEWKQHWQDNSLLATQSR